MGSLPKKNGPSDMTSRTACQSRSRFDDVFVRVAQDTLLPQHVLHTRAHEARDQRADDRGYRIEPGARMLPALVPKDVRVRQDERIVFFQSALHEERDRPLRGVEAGVGIDAAGLHQVIHDQRGVGDAHASVFDERQFALGPLRGSGVSTTS